MRSHRGIGIGVLVAALVAVVAIVAACSKSSNNNPYNPGTGGGTLSLVLPGGGGSATMTFATAAAVPYKCGIHPSIMHGDSVIVTATSPNDSVVVSVVGVTTPGFSPSTVTVKPGGKVRWINGTGMTHSVVNQ